MKSNHNLEEYMTIAMKPLGSRLVIEPKEQDEVTPGGIFLPDTAKE